MTLRELMQRGFYRDIDDAGGGGEIPVETPEGAAPEPVAAPSNVQPPQYVTAEALNDFGASLLGQFQAMLGQSQHREEPEPEPEPPAMPDMYDDPAGYAQYVAQAAVQAAVAPIQHELQALRGEFSQAINPIREREALQSLGGEVAAEYLKDVPAEHRAAIAQIPSVAQAIREATAARMAAQPKQTVAPRSEGNYQGEDMPVTAAMQREIDNAYPSYASQFPGLTKADFTKMVLKKQGRQVGALN